MRLRDEIINSDVFASSKHLRERNTFIREDGTPLYYTLVNIKEWCKNEFEVINQLRINTENSHQRYDVILLINGIPVVQIELKDLAVSPRRAMQQIVDYKSHAGIRILCYASFSCSLSVTGTIRCISPTITHSISADGSSACVALKRFLKVSHLSKTRRLLIIGHA